MKKFKILLALLFLAGIAMDVNAHASVRYLCKSKKQDLNFVLYDFVIFFSNRAGQSLDTMEDLQPNSYWTETVPRKYIKDFYKNTNPWYKRKNLVLVAQILQTDANTISLTLYKSEKFPNIPGAGDDSIRCKAEKLAPVVWNLP